jgi:hypothetical protein
VAVVAALVAIVKEAGGVAAVRAVAGTLRVDVLCCVLRDSWHSSGRGRGRGGSGRGGTLLGCDCTHLMSRAHAPGGGRGGGAYRGGGVASSSGQGGGYRGNSGGNNAGNAARSGSTGFNAAEGAVR